MSEGPDMEPENIINQYNWSDIDRKASADLLDAIRINYRDELDRSGFTKRYLDAMGSVEIYDSEAKLYVIQSYRAGKDLRIIMAVLRQNKDNGFTLHTEKVGEELNDSRIPARYFTEEDLDLAIRQLNELKIMKDLGMISLDSTLSWPANPLPLIE